jgi:hypothetical protein
VVRLRALRWPKAGVDRRIFFAAQGASDHELRSMPTRTTDRVLEVAKVKAYIHSGLGFN